MRGTSLRLPTMMKAIIPLCVAHAASAGTLTSASYQLIGGNVNGGGVAVMTSTASVPTIGDVGGSVGQSEALGLSSESGLDPQSVALGLWPIATGALPSIDADADGVAAAIDNCPGVPNGAQLNFDGDAEGDSCDSDDDNDGLSDSEEAALGTNPLNPDTDGDGWSDAEEVAAGSDPLDENSVPTIPSVPALSTWGLLVVLLLLGMTALGLERKRLRGES